MRGVILAGGTGSRLYPLTKVTNKHLLPVYDWPMIFYPLNTLVGLGIKDIVVVLGGNSVGDVVNLLGDGSSFGDGISLSYVYQQTAAGIADALRLVEPFFHEEDFAVILGDNVFPKLPNVSYEPYTTHIVGVKNENPSAFGVFEVNGSEVVKVTEKPKLLGNMLGNNLLVQTGLYFYNNMAWYALDQIAPSERGELEISDLNSELAQYYGPVYYSEVESWYDAGEHHSLAAATLYIRHAKLEGIFQQFIEVT